MSLKDYFEMGRENQRRYEEKKRMKAPTSSKPKKPGAFSVESVIVGAGVFYEMILPVINKIRPEQKTNTPVHSRQSNPLLEIIKGDIIALFAKITGYGKKWDEYERFIELARGKK